MNGRCCVFQPFDKGPHDKRYDDTIAPAIKSAELEPYRVDRDDGAIIPIETLHEEIRSATLCLADITTVNPNVMYEFGYAVASGKDVVIICSTQRTERFPFDIQHRGMILYASDCASDFDKLKTDITNRIKGLIRKQETTQTIASASFASASPVKSLQGLQPNEIAALSFILANLDSQIEGVSTYTIKQDMEKAGYTRLATRLGLVRLSRIRYVEAFEASGYNGESYMSYRLTTLGEDWLLRNQDKLEMKSSGESPPQDAGFDQGITDEDVPF